MTRREDTPEISVVIPTHNRRDLLRRVLRGLAEQTYAAQRFEVIVVVDGSTDGTQDMLAGERTPYELRVLRQEQQGAAAARNAGAALAQGQAVIFLDDDVVPRPDLVQAHARFHERDDSAVVVGRLLPSTDARRPGWERWEESIFQRIYSNIREGREAVGGVHLYSGNVSVSRKWLLETGGFDVTLVYHEDVDLGHRLQVKGARFYFGDDAAGHHCGHSPDFASWCRRHYRFGHHRLFAQRRAKSSETRSLAQSYGRYHPLTRLMLRLTVGNTLARQLASQSLRVAVTLTDLVGLRPVSNFLYSALAVLHYWHGLQDALGVGSLGQMLRADVDATRRLQET